MTITEHATGSWKWFNNNGIDIESVPSFQYCTPLPNEEINKVQRMDLYRGTEAHGYLHAPLCEQSNRPTQSFLPPTTNQGQGQGQLFAYLVVKDFANYVKERLKRRKLWGTGSQLSIIFERSMQPSLQTPSFDKS